MELELKWSLGKAAGVGVELEWDSESSAGVEVELERKKLKAELELEWSSQKTIGVGAELEWHNPGVAHLWYVVDDSHNQHNSHTENSTAPTAQPRERKTAQNCPISIQRCSPSPLQLHIVAIY